MTPTSHRFPEIPWWVYALAVAVLLWATWSHAQPGQDASPLALCQQELAGWQQMASGQANILRTENQRLTQQLAELRKHVADLEAKAKPAESKK